MILLSLLLAFSLPSNAEAAAPRHSEYQINSPLASQSKRSVREQVQASLMRMESAMEQPSRITEKFRALQRSLSEIELIRDYGAPESRQDKALTDLTVAAMQAIPPEATFKKDRCAAYESEFMNQFDPLAEDEPQEPAVQPAWQALKALCE